MTEETHTVLAFMTVLRGVSLCAWHDYATQTWKGGDGNGQGKNTHHWKL